MAPTADRAEGSEWLADGNKASGGVKRRKSMPKNDRGIWHETLLKVCKEFSAHLHPTMHPVETNGAGMTMKDTIDRYRALVKLFFYFPAHIASPPIWRAAS